MEYLNGKRFWILKEPFSAITSRGRVNVPKGFVTDLASSPKITWAIVSPSDEYLKPAIIHDWLYYDKAFERRTSDEIFYELMWNIDVPKWKLETVYKAVRWFGWMSWK